MITEGTISHATMRPEDLIPAFLEVLEAESPERFKALMADYPEYESEESDFFETDNGELASWMLEALFDALNDIAPEGMYFGATEGDGSDYGFWTAQDF